MGVPAALVAGLVASEYISILPQNKLGGIDIQALLEETHVDRLELTEQPVEAGALITDHSFMQPFEVTLRCGWSNSSLQSLLGTVSALVSGSMPTVNDYVSNIYSQLQALQQSRQPFTIVTGLRQYTNMLLQELQVTRDQKTSQALMVVAVCRQVILVSTQLTTAPAQLQTVQLGEITPAAVNFPTEPGAASVVSTGPTDAFGNTITPSGIGNPVAPSPGGSVPPWVWSPTNNTIGTGGLQ